MKSEVIVLDQGIFAPEEKYLSPKQSKPKQRWCKVIIVINNRYSDILNALFCAIYEEMLYQTNVSLTVYLSLWENFDQSKRNDHRVMW